MASLTDRLRRASDALTLRGRCLIAAGLTCSVIAFPLSEADLLRVGLFLLVVPLVGVLVVSRTRFRLACARQLSAPRVVAGGSTQVDIQLRNDSRVPTTVMLLEDQVPYALGARPRFVVDRLEPTGTRRISYSITPALRGKYRIGPLALTLADPFGCVSVAHEFSSTQDLVVTPPVVALRSLRVASARAHSGEHNARVLSAVGEVDVGTRAYRQGDDLRKIHWRSTARTGELMVRQEQAGRTTKACVILDTRGSAHRGDSVTGSFEWSVSAAASILNHLASGDQPVELISGYGSLPGVSLSSGGALAGEAAYALQLDRLAQITTSEHHRLRPELAMIRSRAIESGSLFVIAGAMSNDDVHALMPLGKLVAAAYAILIDTSAWDVTREAAQDGRLPGALRPPSSRGLQAARKSLLGAGWRVAVAHRGESIADCWMRLGDAR